MIFIVFIFVMAAQFQNTLTSENLKNMFLR